MARILVAEDDDGVRRTFARLLQAAGHEVEEVGSGDQALTAIRRQAPDIAILDVQMPGCDGIEVLQQLRRDPATTTLPIIVITGLGEVESRVRGLLAGANDYISKPVHPDELVARVGAQLGRQQAWQEWMEGSLRDRAAVVNQLNDLAHTLAASDNGGRTPERIADRVCEELLALPQIEFATLLLFTAGEDVQVMAARVMGPRRSPLWPVGSTLPRHKAFDVWRRTSERAWSEEVESADGGRIMIAYAPLHVGPATIGAIALGADGATSPLTPVGLLATVIDVAPVAASALAPAFVSGPLNDERRAAIDKIAADGSFAPAFQPIIDLTSGATVGHEVLTRFADGTPPGQRFAEALTLGISNRLEYAAIEAGLAGASRLPGNGWLALNLSASVLLSRADDIAALAAQHRREIVLELSEQERVDDYEAIVDAISCIPGASLAIDDAGAGYASMLHLIRLQPRFIKLDRAWLVDLAGDVARHALVVGMAHFASQTSSSLIAEGIEHEDQTRVLRELGVPLGQGFLLGEPATFDG